MAYIQKNNPFKVSNNTNKSSPLFTHINADVKEGHHPTEYAEGNKRLVKNRRIASEVVTNTRTELGDKNLYNTPGGNRKFIKAANIEGEDGVRVIDKIMLKGPEFVENFRQEVLKTAEPFLGLTKEQLDSKSYMLGAMYDLDLSNFKPYLKQTNVTANDIRAIIEKQISNMPDRDGNGKPDAFDFWGSEVLLDNVIDLKLKHLED